MEFSDALWRKSSYSGTEGECVEVSFREAAPVGIRDSKNSGGGRLAVSADALRRLTRSVRG